MISSCWQQQQKLSLYVILNYIYILISLHSLFDLLVPLVESHSHPHMVRRRRVVYCISMHHERANDVHFPHRIASPLLNSINCFVNHFLFFRLRTVYRVCCCFRILYVMMVYIHVHVLYCTVLHTNQRVLVASLDPFIVFTSILSFFLSYFIYLSLC